MKSSRKLAVLSLAFCFSALGQNSTASIRGVVTDPAGAAIPRATVTIVNSDKNVTLRTLASGEDGGYAAPLLSVGHYTIKAEAPGFSPTPSPISF